MGWELEPCSSPSAALMTRTSLRPGERLEGTPPRLTLSPAPGTLRLWGHSAAGKESLPPKDRCSYSVSFQTLSPASDVGNTRGHIVLKSQSPAFSFLEVIQDLTVDLIQWWQSLLWRWLDGLSCTWSLRKYWWCKEPRDQLDSGPYDLWTLQCILGSKNPQLEKPESSRNVYLLLKFYTSHDVPYPNAFHSPPPSPHHPFWLQGRGFLPRILLD